MTLFDHISKRTLAHIVRFNASPQHFNESVATHSFFVAYITSLLAKVLEKHGIPIDHEKAVVMGLVHDMDEIFSGDILSPFKHHSKEVNKAIKKVNDVVIADVFEDLPKEMARHYVKLWKEEGKQKTIEAQVVKIADRLSLIAKCKEEMKGGNEFFKEIYEREYRKLKEDVMPWWVKIKDEVLE